jgi:hypothetical protein
MILAISFLAMDVVGQTYSPMFGAQDVSPFPVLEITFEELDVLSFVENKNFTLFKSEGGSYTPVISLSTEIPPVNPWENSIPTDPRLVIEGEKLIINLSGEVLEAGTTYGLYGAPGALLVNGNPFGDLAYYPPVWLFTIEPAIIKPLPTVYTPLQGAPSAPTNQPLSLQFDIDIQAGSGSLEIWEDGGLAAWASYDQTDFGTELTIVANNTLNITLPLDFDEGTSYYVLIDPGFVESTENVAFDGFTTSSDWDFTTVYLPLDPPTLSPINGGTGVLRNSILDVTFDKDIEFGAGGTIEIYNGATQEKLFNKNSANVSIVTNNTLRIDLSGSPLNTYAALYDIRISSGFIKRIGSEVYFAGFDAGEWSFTTEEAPIPADPPYVVANGYSPDAGSVEVSRAPSISVQFDKPIVWGTGGMFFIRKVTGGQAAVTVSPGQVGATISSDKLSIVFTSPLLEYGTQYYIEITNDFVRAFEGAVPFPGIGLSDGWTFTTETAPPAWVDGYPNISNQTVDGFQLDVWADVTGAFYGVLTQSSTQPTAEQIAQGQNSGGSAARIAFNQGVNSIETFSSISIDFNDNAFWGQSCFLHLVYLSAGTYPKYGEIKTIEIDRIIPTVEKTYPANNSMVFPAPDAIEITFSELVVGTNGEALSDAYFSLVQNSSPEAPIQFTVSVSAEGERTVATLRPTTVLMDNTAYTLTIKTVYDLSGNSSAASTISFETDGVAQWTGSSSSSWTDAANWGGTLPVDGKSVLIPGGLSNYPLITSETINVHNLTIAPGAVLSHSGGTINVSGLFHLQSSSDVNASYINTGGDLNATPDSIRVDQVISNPNVTYHISSPVLDATQLSIGSTQVVYFFNNSTGAWESNMNNPLTPGVGYITRSNNNLQFRGDLNFSSFSLPISRSTKGFGWNLIGNPYTAMLDFSKMINDNVEPTFWLWQNERGIYGTMNFESEVFINLNSNFIPSNHAFFVKVKTGVDSTNISFSPDYLSANTTTYLKSGQVSNVDQLKLAAVSGLVEDETAIAFISSASEGVDKYDSEKYLGGSTNVLELFSLVGNTRLAINGMPLDETATIPLGYSTKTAGNYSIKLNTNTTESRLFLHDKVAEVTEELLAGSEYSFNVASSETNHSRFSLVVERVLTGESPKVKNVDGLRAMVKDRKLSVLVSSSMLGAEYYVVDMGGRLLIKGIFTEEGMVDLGQLPIGSYVIQSFNRAVNLQERQKIVVY